MKTKKLFTSLAAAVMLSTSLAGSGALMSQPVQAASTQTAATTTKSDNSISIKARSVSAVVNSDKPKLYALSEDSKSFTPIDSSYVKGQNIEVYFSTTATKSNGESETFYYVDTQTVNGQDSMVFISASDVTTSSTVPTYEAWSKQKENDASAIEAAYKNREVKYIVVTPKSKKGAKIYYAYKKSKKSKKIYFKASKKKIKYGKKYKTSSIVKHGKTKYVYIGKKRYIKQSAVKISSVKYEDVNLSDDLKALIVEN